MCSGSRKASALPVHLSAMVLKSSSVELVVDNAKTTRRSRPSAVATESSSLRNRETNGRCTARPTTALRATTNGRKRGLPTSASKKSVHFNDNECAFEPVYLSRSEAVEKPAVSYVASSRSCRWEDAAATTANTSTVATGRGGSIGAAAFSSPCKPPVRRASKDDDLLQMIPLLDFPVELYEEDGSDNTDTTGEDDDLQASFGSIGSNNKESSSPCWRLATRRDNNKNPLVVPPQNHPPHYNRRF